MIIHREVPYLLQPNATKPVVARKEVPYLLTPSHRHLKT